MTIGLLGGSFNPVHIGHMVVASYMSQFAGLDAVWMVLSPLNPLKSRPEELIPDIQRLKMLEIATSSAPGIEVCDIELSMPRPSYTVDTLNLLKKRYPRKNFRLIIGSDNWKQFKQWRDYERIIEETGVMVYPRPGYPVSRVYEDNVEIVTAPQCEISSSFIRMALKKGRDMRYFLPQGVGEYIKQNHLYLPKTNG